MAVKNVCMYIIVYVFQIVVFYLLYTRRKAWTALVDEGKDDTAEADEGNYY